MEDSRIIDLYKTNDTLDTKYIILKSILYFDLEEDSAVFVDEVQLSEEFIKNLKYIDEMYPNVNIICASFLLGVKLKRFNGLFPVGKVELLNLYNLFLITGGMPAAIYELVKNNFKLYYWNDQEVDFVIKINNDIVSVEVKAADNTQSKTLKILGIMVIVKLNLFHFMQLSALKVKIKLK